MKRLSRFNGNFAFFAVNSGHSTGDKEDKMFATRLISGIILVVLALFLVGQGGVVLFLASLGISVIGQYELYRVTKM